MVKQREKLTDKFSSIDDNEKQKLIIFCVFSLILLLGVGIRLQYVMKTDWILGDGGLFYQMILDLENNGFRLPIYTTYNNASIPFCYPFFSFYLLGFFHKFLGIDLIELFRIIPVLFNIASLPIVYLVLNEVLKDHKKALIAFYLYIFSTRVFEWLIIGGGITRSPAYFFAVLAIYVWVRAIDQDAVKLFVVSGLLVGLVGLIHTGIFFGVVVVVVILNFKNGFARGWFKRLAICGGVAFVILLFWIIPVIKTHGLNVILSASGSGGILHFQTIKQALITYKRGQLLFFTIQRVAFVLSFFLLLRKQYFLPVWFALLSIILSRQAEMFIALPAVMVIASSTIQIVEFVLNPEDSKFQKRVITALCVLLLMATFIGSLADVYMKMNIANKVLSEEDRGAMSWVQINTEESADFLVIPFDLYSQAVIAEWFPYLTQRRSELTIQGLEWLGSFDAMAKKNSILDETLSYSYESFFNYVDELGITYDYLYCSNTLTENMICPIQIAGHRTVYEEDGVYIYQLEMP